MASTTLLLNGFSILNDPRANTNASHGGELMVHDGTAAFEDDDIIVFEVDNVTVDGVLTDDSVITGIIVYDNAADYYNDTPLYTYSYSGSGDGAEIPDGRQGMGDTYLRFDASELTSSDAGAPVLEDLVAVAGVDLVDLVEQGVNPIEVATFLDVDINNDGQITGGETADGSFSSALNDWIPICFAAGTLIDTPNGPRYVETLREGDTVNTLDSGAQTIRWAGSFSTPGDGGNAPICFRAGAVGNIRDLFVSPNHRMIQRGAQAELLFGQNEVLVAAKHLVNGQSILPMPRRTVTYCHFLLDRHEIVFAEGCATESLLPGPQTLKNVDPDARDEIVAIFPDLAKSQRNQRASRYTLLGYEARAFQVAS